MIFCGDISIPFSSGVQLAGLSEDMRRRSWFANLEGTLIDDESSAECLSQKGVFNSFAAIKELSSQINVAAFNLANNHITDFSHVHDTCRLLDNLHIPYVGAGSNIEDASRPLDIEDGQDSFRILSFGWDCIDCVPATSVRDGVNPYIRKHVLDSFKKYYSDEKKMVCFFHWNYELEKIPSPYDRQLSKDLIDMGCYAVIGCHAHRTQQIEFYKGRPIIYGLGNFLFRQGAYFNGHLRFPDCSYDEWGVELISDKVFLHRFSYSPDNHVCTWLSCEEISEAKAFAGEAEYSGLSSREYESFFRKNRVQRRLLPVFKSHEGCIGYNAKTLWVKARGCLINVLSSLSLKSIERRGVK